LLETWPGSLLLVIVSISGAYCRYSGLWRQRVVGVTDTLITINGVTSMFCLILNQSSDSCYSETVVCVIPVIVTTLCHTNFDEFAQCVMDNHRMAVPNIPFLASAMVANGLFDGSDRTTTHKSYSLNMFTMRHPG
jgi:hypothetical protein